MHGVFKERQNGTSRVQIVTQMAFHPEVPLSCTISKKKKKRKKERKERKEKKSHQRNLSPSLRFLILPFKYELQLILPREYEIIAKILQLRSINPQNKLKKTGQFVLEEQNY